MLAQATSNWGASVMAECRHALTAEQCDATQLHASPTDPMPMPPRESAWPAVRHITLPPARRSNRATSISGVSMLVARY